MRKNQRRLKYSRLKKLYICNRTVTKDSEGVPTESYGQPVEVIGEVWPAQGSRQIEQYGDRISGISNVRLATQYTYTVVGNVPTVTLPDETTILVGDGMCIDTDSAPDFTVIAIRPYQPLKLEVERI